MLDTNSTIRGFGDEPGLVTICIVILLVGIIIQLKYFKYSRTQPDRKAWDKTNEKNRVQYHTVFTIMVVLGKVLAKNLLAGLRLSSQKIGNFRNFEKFGHLVKHRKRRLRANLGCVGMF